MINVAIVLRNEAGCELYTLRMAIAEGPDLDPDRMITDTLRSMLLNGTLTVAVGDSIHIVRE